MKSPAIKTKISLSESASWLSSLCQRIDDGEPVETLLEDFTAARLATADGVARGIMRLNILDESAKSARAKAAAWTALARNLEGAYEKFEQRTLQTIQDNPEIPFKSDIGVLAVQRNSNPKLLLDFETFERRYSNAVTFETLESFSIPQRYYTVVEALAFLNLDEIKDDLKVDNFPHSWGRLGYGTHLKIK